MGWGFTYMVAFRAILAVRDGAASLWRGLVLASFVWFAVNSFFSALTGFAANIIPNILLFVSLLTPLLASGALRDQPVRD